MVTPISLPLAEAISTRSQGSHCRRSSVYGTPLGSKLRLRRWGCPRPVVDLGSAIKTRRNESGPWAAQSDSGTTEGSSTGTTRHVRSSRFTLTEDSETGMSRAR